MRKGIPLMVLMALTGAPAVAFAGAATGGATLPEQIVQEGTEVEQLAKQAESVELQIQKVYDAAQNLAQVPNQLWQQGVQSLAQLASIANQANGLSMAGQNIASQFGQQYPGFNAQALATVQQYRQWSQNTLNSIQGALATQNMSTEDFQTNAQALQTIEAEPVSGRLQALQVGNQIAANEATSLQELGQMVATQEHAQDAYLAQQASARQATVENDEQWKQSTLSAINSGNPYNN
ncbi:P-type conjugative transfer protein TrbJ [Acidithiobacillus sp.]|uniref:P-type conjugative transfer protein TrbJ n=1 Tax=Acidithiobacillus sp. TaxID=1872118 RepID=UPI003CFCBCF2